jgi:adenine/guanine phosphoribosyltransferase-like PRPP-binding protein
MHVLSVPKEYNVKRHRTSLHEEKLKKYEGASRTALLEDYKKKLKQQTGLFTKVLKTQTSGLTVSYAVALELAKTKKPFSDGMLVKKMCCGNGKNIWR